MNRSKPLAVYRQNIETYTLIRTKVRRQKNIISWARLSVSVSTIILFLLTKENSFQLAMLVVVAGIAGFLRLVVVAINLNQKLLNLDRLIGINRQELEIAAGHYHHLPDGLIHLPPVHHYAYDLDIFGRASLFQFINRTTSEQGSATLATWLLQPANETIILQRQEAVKELGIKVNWRQQLQAHGVATMITLTTQQKIEQWLHEENAYFRKPLWQVVRYAGPVAALAGLFLYLTDIIGYPAFYLWLFFFFCITGYISKKATPAYHTLNKIAPEIATLAAVIRQVEDESFESTWLQQLQQRFLQHSTKASAAVKKLNGILSRLDYRLNPVVFIPLNIFLFWDLQQMLAFEKWKQLYFKEILSWFEAIGQAEAINSLATLHFNYPQWAFPAINQQHGDFNAVALGHPLIAENKVVRSSFVAKGTGKVAIITGSNMAGKSTFLRSIGLALVMGQAGAPVCAAEAAFACMKVMSTMRVSDNLEESTSTFYAELKKLKDIIDAVNHQEKVYLLLDEILRGTNSLDRHTGSEALIRQLITHAASGIIATHDLALAALIHTYPENIDNYHFDVQVAGEELFFDYKLKNGICRSLNASVLMKKIGIQM